jgi:hypothetical protein
VKLHVLEARSATEAAVQPETNYARLGRDRIAYQVLGEGPPDLVMTTGSFGHVDANPMAIFFAGTQPERTRALILANATASPRAIQAFLRASFEMDACAILPLIQAPTLVLHRRDCQLVPVAHGRYLAERIPGATLIELPGTELSLFWETPELALDHVERFITGVRRVAQPTRLLATVLFTDIVGSTQRAGKLGDRRWRELLNVHDELTGRLVEEFGGRLVQRTGDGILATFDGPGRAIHCAAALREELAGIGIQLRAGCTPARSSCAGTTSAASPSTSRLG